MPPSRVEVQPGTGSASAVTAAITVPARSRALVCSWSSRYRSKQASPASGVSAGSTQVANESALTAIGSVGTRSGAGSPPSSRATSAVSRSTCRARRSTACPDSVTCTGLVRTSRIRPVATSRARSRWLIADGVTAAPGRRRRRAHHSGAVRRRVRARARPGADRRHRRPERLRPATGTPPRARGRGRGGVRVLRPRADGTSPPASSLLVELDAGRGPRTPRCSTGESPTSPRGGGGQDCRRTAGWGRGNSGGGARAVPRVSLAPAPTVSLDDRFARELPELALPWQADEVPDPQLLVLNDALATELGLDPDALRSPEGVRLLVGNAVPEGAKPVAQAYAGHQFGGFVPRLGDGRALPLGGLTDVEGRLRDLPLKGSGRTPFSRGGDGLAAVGPMLREYVISEAMHALGIPTTRSLAVVATGRRVRRESSLPGAVLARVASSHLRVGSFQYARATGDVALLRRLADHAITRHHPDAAEAEHPYLALFEAVVAAQASLVARWMLVGFVHGVMNTDNMTISGETIDYGPCAFMEAFDPATVFSSIDVGGRYAYGNQPIVAEWNLARFAETLLPLLSDDQEQAVALAVAALERFRPQYNAAWVAGMRAKLGLPEGLADDVATAVVEDLLAVMQESRVDLTSFLRALGTAARGDAEPARLVVVDLARFDAWLERWRALGPDADAMDRVNPVYTPRNHLVEEALQAATTGDLGPLQQLLEVLAAPYDERPGLERYAAPAPGGTGPYRTFCGT